MENKNGDNENSQPPKRKRSTLYWAMIITLPLLMYFVFNSASRQLEMDYTSFIKDVEAGNVSQVVLSRNRMALTAYRKTQTAGGKKQSEQSTGVPQPAQPEFKMRFVNLPSAFTDGGPLHQKLDQANVIVAAKNAEPSVVITILSWVLPVLIFVAVWIYFTRKNSMFSGGISQLTLGRFKNRLHGAGVIPNVKFADIAGCDEAKEELQEFVEFLKSPLKFCRLGGEIPKGVLLTGPPGCGKTLLAKAVAGEANVSFFSLSGSDFVEMFVGVGAARVRELFETAKKNSPSIIFMDEIDAVGRHRGAGLGGGHDEREQTLNQLLVELDGFETSTTVILLAATNRPDILDPALLRSGRFDRQVVVPRPDVRGRQKILEIHSKNIVLAKSVRLDLVARSSPGLSGADLKNIVNEAAIFATRDGSNEVGQKHFDLAIDKITTGQERKSAIIPPRVKDVVSRHEAGHALVAAVLPGTDPLHKVSIIPRGMALGITQQIPKEDAYLHSRIYLLNRLTVLMAGREAELEWFSGEPSTGATDDITKATEVARNMVCKWGMSEILGPVTYGEDREMVFLGRELSRQQNYSEETLRAIDNEIKRIIEGSSKIARSLIRKHRMAFTKISEGLIEKETLSGEEISLIISENPPLN